MMKRPLFVLGLLCLAGTAAAVFLPAALSWGLCLLAAAAGVCLLFCQRGRASAWPLCLCFLACSVLAARGYLPLRAAPLLWLDGQTVQLEGMVRQVNTQPRYTAYDLDARVSAPQGAASVSLRLYSYQPFEAQPGDTVRGEVTLRLANAYDKTGWSLLRSGRYFSASGGSVERCAGNGGWRASLFSLNRSMQRRNAAALPGQDGELLTAMLLGDTSRLDASVSDALMCAGLSHVTAVSGFHLGVLVGSLLGVLHALRVRRRWCALAAAPAVVVFMALAGFSPSVVRAGCMALVMLSGLLLRQRYDSRTAWGGAVLLTCLLNPYSITDIGCVLSYSATLGILCTLPHWEEGTKRLLSGVALRPLRRMLHGLLAGVGVTVSALLFSLPFLMGFFGYLNPWAWLSSLLVLPVVSLLLGVSMLAHLLCLLPWFEPLGMLLLGACAPLCRLVVLLSGWLSRLPLAVYPVRYRFVFIALVLCCVLVYLALACPALQAWRRVCGSAALCLGTGALCLAQIFSMQTVTVSLVEGSDCLVLSQGDRAVVWGSVPTRYEEGTLRRCLKTGGFREIWMVIPEDEADRAAYAAELAQAVLPDVLVMPQTGRYLPHLEHTPVLQVKQLAPMFLSLGPRNVLSLRHNSGGWSLLLQTGHTKFLKSQQEYAIIEEIPPQTTLICSAENRLQGPAPLRCLATFGVESFAVW